MRIDGYPGLFSFLGDIITVILSRIRHSEKILKYCRITKSVDTAIIQEIPRVPYSLTEKRDAPQNERYAPSPATTPPPKLYLDKVAEIIDFVFKDSIIIQCVFSKI